MNTRVNPSLTPKLDKNDLLFIAAAFLLGRTVFFILSSMYAGDETLTVALSQWDTGWYHSIAANGYDAVPHAHQAGDAANWAFFPMYPIMVRIISNITGWQIGLTGIVASNTAFAIMNVYLYRYCLQLADRQTARNVIAILSVSPFSLYFSVMYTEGMYSALMIALIYYAYNSKWIVAGFLGVLLSATRNLGVMIVFPMLVIVVRQQGWKQLLLLRRGTEPAVFAIMLAPLGLFAYMLYLYQLTGDALAFSHIQRAWGREIGNPFVHLINGFSSGSDGTIYNTLLALTGIASSACLWNKKLQAEAFIMLIGTIVPLSTGMWSMQRYVGTLFPLYLLIGITTRDRVWLKVAAITLFAFLFMFYIRSWVGGKGFMI